MALRVPRWHVILLLVLSFLVLLHLLHFNSGLKAAHSPEVDFTPSLRPIVSLASSSKRLHNELPVALWSLLRQTMPAKEVRVYLPWQEEKKIAEEMRRGELDPVLVDPRVRLIFVEDMGPAVKFLPVLQEMLDGASQDSAMLDQPLIILDDDHAYSPALIETLMDSHARKNVVSNGKVAVGLRGWRVRKDLKWGVGPEDLARHVIESYKIGDNYEVGVLTANEGYLVIPRFFLSDDLKSLSDLLPSASKAAISDYSAAPEAARLVDDIWMSGHLSRAGCRKFVVPLRPSAPPNLDITDSHPLEEHMASHSVSRSEANDQTLAFFANDWDPQLWFPTSLQEEREQAAIPPWASRVKELIIEMAGRLDEVRAPPFQCGISFLQVGDDADAAAFLQELDDDIKAEAGVRDMVDTIPYDGNALTADFFARKKACLGSVVKNLDRQSV